MSFDPETVDAPYLPNINLRSLIANGSVKVVALKERLSAESVAALEGKKPTKRLLHKLLTHSALGIAPSGEKAFLYLKGSTLKLISPAEIDLAVEGLGELKWDKADNSLRTALRGSGGREKHFGWREAFNKIVTYAATYQQRAVYIKLWPLLDKMEGIYARCMPQVWGDANLAKQVAEQFAHPVEGQDGYSTFSAIQLLWNVPSRIHLDPGNQKKSMTVLCSFGSYRGGSFLLPQYGIGVKIEAGDVLIARTHEEWHCNLGKPKGTKYSVIAYAREPKQ